MLKLSHKYCKAAIESCPQGKTPSNGNIELVDREIETTEKEWNGNFRKENDNIWSKKIHWMDSIAEWRWLRSQWT